MSKETTAQQDKNHLSYVAVGNKYNIYHKVHVSDRSSLIFIYVLQHPKKHTQVKTKGGSRE